MIKRLLIAIVLISAVQSCGDDLSQKGTNQSVLNSRNQISTLEQELGELSVNRASVREMEQIRSQLNDSLLAFYRNHPNDDYAPQSLEKLHMSCLIQKDFNSAITYGDTLVEQFPEHTNRMIILESLSNIYDMDVRPRNKEKIKHYLETILEDYPEIPDEKKADIRYRLDNIDLSIEDIMFKQLEELN